MQIQVEKLRNTLKMLGPVIPKKTTLNVIKSVLLKEGKAIATDLETAVIADLDEATDTCLIPFEPVSKLVELIPGDNIISIETGKKEIKFSWPGGKASYPTGDYLDFPEVNKFDAPVIMGDIDGNALINTMSKMVKYAATETSRPILKAVHLLLGAKITAVAADGFRMVYQELPISLGNENDTVSLNLETIEILGNVWKREPAVAPTGDTIFSKIIGIRKITVGIGNEKSETHQWIGFRFGRVKVLAKLVVGTPPKFAALIPNTTIKIKVVASFFRQAVLRTREIAKSSSDIVRLKWAGNEMEIYAHAEEMGDISQIIQVFSPTDKPGHIALNAKYLDDYLTGKEGIVTLGVTNNDGTSPAVLEHSNTPLTVIMPMAVAWEEPVTVGAKNEPDEAEEGEETESDKE
jgi:DNA polymerase III sliding clamp (beta) subunit (PCNA family)